MLYDLYKGKKSVEIEYLYVGTIYRVRQQNASQEKEKKLNTNQAEPVAARSWAAVNFSPFPVRRLVA